MPDSPPLTGRTILVTRARSQAQRLVSGLEALGGTVYTFAAIAINDPDSWAPLDEAIAGLDRYRWLVVTSPNGAERFAARLAAGRPGGALPDSLRVAAVGSATANRLNGLGIRVDLIPPEFRGAALPGALEPRLVPGDRILMPRGNLADPALARRLEALGAAVDDVVAYRTVPGDGNADQLKTDLSAGRIDWVTFTSGSTAEHLLERLGGPAALTGVRVAVLGPETEKAVRGLGLPVHVTAREVTSDGLVNAIVEAETS